MRRLEFASLQVRDLEASKEFYTQKLGFEEAGIPNPHACVLNTIRVRQVLPLERPSVIWKEKNWASAPHSGLQSMGK